MIFARLCSALLMLLLAQLGATAYAQAVEPTPLVVAPAEVARRDEAAFQRRQAQRNAQAEIVRLRRDRPGLFLPIAVTSAGGVAALGLAELVAFAFWIEAAGNSREAARHELLHDMRPFWIAAGVGALVAGAGAVWLVHRIHARRPYSERIRALQALRF